MRNMGVAPAGIQYVDSGHHLVLVEWTPVPALNLSIINGLKTTATSCKGKTECHPVVDSLQLLLGDFAHMNLLVDSRQILITVE